MIRDFLEIYRALACKEPSDLAPVTPYVNYIKWLEKQDRQEGLAYWQQYLEGYEEKAVLPEPVIPRAASAENDYKQEKYNRVMDEGLSALLGAIAAQRNVTVNVLFQVLWAVLLQKYNNTNDVVFGAVVSGRPPEIQDIENMTGLLINTIPVRITIENEEGKGNFSRLLGVAQQKALKSNPYEYLPLAEVQAQSLLKGDLIDHIMVFENFPLEGIITHQKNENNPGFFVSSAEIKGQTNYDFSIVIMPEKSFIVEFKYNSLRYDNQTIKRIAHHLKKIITDVCREPETDVNTLEIITEEEKKQVLSEFNDTRVQYPGDKTIVDLVAEQVEQTPDNTALVDGNPISQIPNPKHGATFGGCGAPGLLESFGAGHLTYRELNNKSNRLAHLLWEKGVRPDTIVGIMLERSIEMIAAILGILKAGGAYLPIDPEYPPERIDFMLKDSNARILLTKQEMAGLFSPQAFNNRPKGASFHLHLSPAPATSLAYIIYTSGSTGKPKGVLVEQRSVVNLVSFHKRYYRLDENDRILQFSSFCFDASVKQIFMTLHSGAVLVLPDKKTLTDRSKFEVFIHRHSITHINAVPSFLNNINLKGNPQLRHIVSGGEACPVPLTRKLSRYGKFYNSYGPTETTIASVVMKFEKIDPGLHQLPIGKPIDNTNIYILDRWLNLVPIGVTGEMYIGGVGVARGYLNRPELTAEKFINNALSSWLLALRRTGRATNAFGGHNQPGAFQEISRARGQELKPNPPTLRAKSKELRAKLYKTGDLGRWLPNGTIDFSGRIDQQVKIRGFRIELGEIEKHLLNYKHINQAVVTAKTDLAGDKYLAAYIVLEPPVSEKAIAGEQLRRYLSGQLPGYMIPSYFVQLEEMPLTSNGKIDKKALPEPGLITHKDYQGPRNVNEEKLAAVWQDVLGSRNKRIGIKDNFFEIGGDSIKAIQISGRLQKFGLKLEIADLFGNPTIEALSKCVKKIERKIPQGIVEGQVELTPTQERFFENHSTGNHHFNQAVMLYRAEGFDNKTLSEVFTKIVEHHDALRMVYKKENHNWEQINRGLAGKLFDLEVIDLTGIIDTEIENEVKTAADRIQASFNLETGPLVKLGLFKTNAGDHLLVVIHHLVVDGVSWRILLEDFATGYEQVQAGEKIKFQEKTDSYQHWAAQLKAYSFTKEFLRESGYWKTIENITVQKLPKECREQTGIEKRKNKYLQRIVMELEKEATGKLLQQVNAAYSTEINDILLTALGLAIKDWAKIDRVLVNLEGHGREQIIRDINVDRTIGWFTSLYPVILDMRKAGELSYHIKSIKETLRRIPKKGIGYGILKYLTPREKKEGITFRAEPEISFNYLGQFGQESHTELIPFSHFSPGTTASPGMEHQYAIEINGMLVGKRLSITFSYNRHEYDKHRIEELSEGYRLHLLEIIDHCSKKPGKESTPSDVGYSHISLESFANIVDLIKNNTGGNTELQLMYPLSPMQAGMLYHSVKNTSDSAYLSQTVFSLQGTVDRSLIERSFNKLVQRYDILRTCFVYEGLDEPLQVVLKERNIRVYYENIVHLSAKEKADYLEKLKLKDREKPYDLSRDILTRLRLLKTGTNSYKLLWSHHHILMDGWCLGILFREFLHVYRAMPGKEPLDTLNLSPVTPYMTYIKWLGKQDKQEGLDYWRHYLEGYETRTGLPKPGIPTVTNDYKLEKYTWTIDDTLPGELSTLAAKRNVTVNAVFQTMWGILLQKYNRSHDVVFGAVVSGRPAGIENIENMLGLFINTVPVRVKVEEDTRQFSRLLLHVGQRSLLSMSYEYLPLAEVQAVTSLKGDLIDHLMVFENYPLDDATAYQNKENNPGFFVTDVEIREQTNYDFNIAVIPADRYFTVNFIYNSLAYNHQTIERISRHLEKIIKQVSNDPGIEVDAIEIITDEEKKQVLFDFNNTAADYPADKTIQQLFAEQVERTPDNTALVGGNPKSQIPNPKHGAPPGGCGAPGLLESFGAGHLTYRELHDQSNQLAHLLWEKGVRPDTTVGIMLERSIDTIVGMLGILKAGGAYLPIDPNNPEERIQYMLTDSNVIFLVKNSNNISVLGIKKDIDIIFIEDYINKNRPKGTSSHLHLSPAPVTSLAYIIYTSGSTGRPKGVLIRHSGFANLITRHRQIFGENNRSRISQVANPAFDAMAFEVWPCLSSGASLVIASNATLLEPVKMKEWLIKESITISFQPTALAERLLDEKWPGEGAALKVLRTAGDRLTRYPAHPYPFRFFNLYGPTEDTVWTTWTEVQPDVNPGKYPGIGKPLANHRVYIVGPNWELQPIGISGELCISGIGLALGYLNQPELTKEKFINNALSSWLLALRRTGRATNAFRGHNQPGAFQEISRARGQELKPNPPTLRAKSKELRAKLYKTGDLARWQPDGNIEFIGRTDHQVKVRGFRIELQEIENQLLKHSHIKEAVVLAKKEVENKYLCAYFVAQKELESSEIKNYLSLRLPHYMVPAYVVQLNELPLTANGKIDRKKLTAYEETGTPSTPAYAAAETDMEKQVLDIWRDVLHRDEVGVQDNFFEIGGNSINILTLQGKLKKYLDKDIPITDLFRYPTVRSLAAYLWKTQENAHQVTGARDRLEEVSHEQKIDKSQDIAVIGMAGVFPGAGNIHEFWENLKNGVESITFFRDEELGEPGIPPNLLKNPNFVKAKGIIDDWEYFDASFFDYTPREAQVMNPQVRIFHQCVWHALEDAGYDPHSYPGRISLYAGAGTSFSWQGLVAFSKEGQALTGTQALQLADKDFMCTRISYKLNLKGSSFGVQSACSTSLVAIHLAVRELLNGECEIALAGGITVSYPMKQGRLYQEGMIQSPDGHCRAFDAKAKGVIGGSGAGVVVLKRLEKAKTHRDNIYALIKGSAINNDGTRKIGYSAPGVEGQAEVIRTALSTAGVKPESITYIEAHGTGTPLGDPVEAAALRLAFNTGKKGFCGIGSVKTNVGHLDAAAGVTGFIKTVLALKHRLIPPSLHFNTPNPKLDLENSPFYVVTTPTGWKPQENAAPLRAGVSSLGIGGTNAHVVLEGLSEGTRGLDPLHIEHSPRSYQLILLSAKTPSALDKMTENLVNFLKENRVNHGNPLNPGLTLADVAYTLQLGRKAFPYRKMAVCTGVDEALDILAKKSKKVQTSLYKEENRPIIFVFAGQGSQYVNMGLELYHTEPVFRKEIDRSFEMLTPILGNDAKKILYPHSDCRGGSLCPPRDTVGSPGQDDHRGSPLQSDQINQLEIIQAVIFIFEYALAKLLMSWGIKPRAMIGYSLGEYTAACISGVFSLEDALKTVVSRGKLIRQTPVGAMLGVPLPENEVKPLLPPGISLAIVNGPSCVVAGSTGAIDSFEKEMKTKRLLCTRVNITHAIHSELMNPIREKFAANLQEIKLNDPQIPFISNVTGKWLTGEQAKSPGCWAEQLCGTVRFSDGITELLKKDNAIFIEIGPGRVLSTIIRQHPDIKTNQKVVNLVKHQPEKTADVYLLLSTIGQLWLNGIAVNWQEYYQGEKRRRISLPGYPFEGKPYRPGSIPSLAGIAALTGQSMPVKQPEAANGFGSRLAGWMAQQGVEIVSEPGTNEEEMLFRHILGEINAHSPGKIIAYPNNQHRDRTLEPGTPEDYKAPRDELEKIISGLWQQVLGFERIGIHDNFFDLNGDSLTATQLVARINEKYSIEVSIQEFFAEPTIAHLAIMVKKLLTEKIKNLAPGDKKQLAARLAANRK